MCFLVVDSFFHMNDVMRGERRSSTRANVRRRSGQCAGRCDSTEEQQNSGAREGLDEGGAQNQNSHRPKPPALLAALERLERQRRRDDACQRHHIRGLIPIWKKSEATGKILDLRPERRPVTGRQ